MKPKTAHEIINDLLSEDSPELYLEKWASSIIEYCKEKSNSDLDILNDEIVNFNMYGNRKFRI